VQKAVAYLYNEQLENGGFSADGQENSNSVAQAIIGLSLVKDVDQNRLHKAMQNLLSYQLPNGEFKWLPGDQNGSGMATEQALLALLQFKIISVCSIHFNYKYFILILSFKIPNA